MSERNVLGPSACPVCAGHGKVIHFVSEKVSESIKCYGCRGSGEVRPFSNIESVIRLKIKKLHPDAVIPKYSKFGDAGLDFTAIDNGTDVWPKDEPHKAYFYREYSTGIAVEIPYGYVGLCFPRSSQSTTGLMLANAVGCVDAGFRGEVKGRFKIDSTLSVLSGAKGVKAYVKGDRIFQMVILKLPDVDVQEVQELSPSERGTSGWGSSGA